MFRRLLLSLLTLLVATLSFASSAQNCDHRCLEGIADAYRKAYLAHDPSLAPFAEHVVFSENNIMMPFPEGTWDTITEDLGPPLVMTDPVSGNIGIYTAIMQMDTPGFLAVRLGVRHGRITEVEHIISTKRNLSAPPTPIGEVKEYVHEPELFETIPADQRLPREKLIALADGYFSTLARNNGEIRGTCFAPEATRRENGLLFKDIEGGFKSGFYLFNERVRRVHVLVDEEHGIVMSRGFIDHKGNIDKYSTVDGREITSVYREPHSWAFLESFKIKNGCIAAVVADFIGAPYYMQAPWNAPQYGYLGP